MSTTKPSHTRRGFLAILGGSAAVLAIRPIFPAEPERPQSPWKPKNRWIGHC